MDGLGAPGPRPAPAQSAWEAGRAGGGDRRGLKVSIYSHRGEQRFGLCPRPSHWVPEGGRDLGGGTEGSWIWGQGSDSTAGTGLVP